MKLITFKDIINLNIPVSEYYGWTEEMIAQKNDAILPPKISIKPEPGVFCNVMPSVVKANGVSYGGVKVVTRYPERKPSLDSKIMLFNIDNGDVLALMDGDWITAMRTGTVAAHSIMTLAKTDFRIIGMVGLGNVARTTLDVLLTMMPERHFKVKLYRYHGTEVDFSKRFRDYPNVEFSFVDDYYSIVKGSDVVISCVTYAPVDFCPDEAFDEGILVVPVHTLGFTNCDLFFDKVFADDTGHVCHFKNFDKFRRFAEMGDVVNGKAPGRENDRERILSYNIGISIHDIYFASRIFNILKDKEGIPEIDLAGPTEKYWA